MNTCSAYYQSVNKAFAYESHGTLGGVSTWARGGNFSIGFASGTVASFMSTTAGVLTQNLCEAWQVTCMLAAGTLSGGVTASMAGGSFWEGVCNGLICSGLNHALHLTCETISGPDDPPGGENDAHKEQENNLNKLGVAVGTGEAGLIESASWTTIKMLKLDIEKPATLGTKMLKNIKGVAGTLGIAGGLVSGYLDFQAYQSGSLTFNEFLSRSGVTLLEVGLSFVCPPAGFVLSTIDVCGGLDWFYK